MNSEAEKEESDTLVRRLAGPSSGKAGLAKDQSEINRIIADVSKGSKFYENEKKKDKELSDRIEKILKKRDEVSKGVDIRFAAKIELAVDYLLAQLEAERDLSQTIVHVDMDAFYANVELLHNPDLEGKPFAVGFGVLTTASYEARKYGVRSGMAGFVAKKLCPDLIFVPNKFNRYAEMSNRIMAIFKQYDPHMCPAGCDEGYLNITSYCETHSLTAGECVQAMRQAVFEVTKLTVSAGIAPNKMLAKICSDKNKPNGQFHLPFDPRSIKEFMRKLSIRKVPGIGRVNERVLESIGIKTCGDIFTHRATISLMDKEFGLHFLLRTHLGIASNKVQPPQREERKSVGAERTFSPLSDKEKILRKLSEIAADLEGDLKRGGWTGRTVTLKYKLDTYQVFTRAKSFGHWVSTKEELFATGKDLLLPELPMKLRLIGLRMTKLKDLRDSSSKGIKQFFGPIKGEPSHKRRKLDEIEKGIPLIEATDSTDASEEQDPIDEDAMPGYHEHDETDLDPSQHQSDHEEDNIIEEPEKLKPRPPVSEPSRPVSMVNGPPASNSRNMGRPRSTSEVKLKPVSIPKAAPMLQDTDWHECPICDKSLQTDNQGLNAHIDFCLSRGAIREAHAEASSPVKRSSKTASEKKWAWPKPESNRRVSNETKGLKKDKLV